MTSTTPSRSRRRWNWIIGVLVLLVVVLVGGTWWLEKAVLERSERIMAQASGPGAAIDIGAVDIHLFQGDIRWSDLRIRQNQNPSDTASDKAMHVTGTVRSVAVKGLSLWRLLVTNTLSMRALTIDHPQLTAFLRTDTADLKPATTSSFVLSALNTDSLVLEQAMLGFHRVTDSLDVSLDTLNLTVISLRSRWPEGKPFEVQVGAVMGQMRGIAASLPPLHRLRIARIDLKDEGHALQVMDARVTPTETAEAYGRLVRYETDLVDLHLDTAALEGLDPIGLITGRSLHAGIMRISGVDLDISRDKTIRDRAFKHKPLPARTLRQLPFALCLDSVILDRWNVTYHEKGSLTPDFGEVTFNDIHAEVRGVCNTSTSLTDTVVANATAKGFDHADLVLELRTVIADPSDRFIAKATVGRLPFSMFNRMTSDLLLVRATAGTVGAVHFTMNATDTRATGRVDMEYTGLEVELLKKDGSGKPRRFLSNVVNEVVHGENVRSGDDEFRHGDFSYDRDVNRSFFNYLWSGLREGMIVTVLPGVVDDLRPQPGKSGTN